MLKITLPFPPPELNPNDRTHWKKKNQIKKEYRARCKLEAQIYSPKFDSHKIVLFIMFVPRTNRGDWDNMIAAMKAGFDGMADAWGIDDVRFRPGGIDIAEKDHKFPRVEIYIKNIQV